VLIVDLDYGVLRGGVQRDDGGRRRLAKAMRHELEHEKGTPSTQLSGTAPHCQL